MSSSPDWRYLRSPGLSGQVAGTGDFTGDGRDDILWRGVNGDNVIWPGGNAPGFWLSALAGGWQVAGIGDFDRNGSSDILWRCLPQAPAAACGGAAIGTVAIWQFSNGNYGWTSWPGGLDGHWRLEGVGDFDGNGASDIAWRCLPQSPASACGSAAAGSVAIWQFNGGVAAWTTWAGVLDASWRLERIGRLDR